jgi:hypothetical protein
MDSAAASQGDLHSKSDDEGKREGAECCFHKGEAEGMYYRKRDCVCKSKRGRISSVESGDSSSKASLAISQSVPGPLFLRYYPDHRLMAWQPRRGAENQPAVRRRVIANQSIFAGMLVY